MKAVKIILCASIINLAALFLAVQRLPETVPIHLNINMEADRYGSRWIILITGFISVVYAVIVHYCLKHDKVQKQNKKILNIFLPSVTVFLIALTWLPALIAFLYVDPTAEPPKIPIDFIVAFPIGVLLIVLSNFLGVIKPNFWMGMRLPWTFADKTVWKKTHRLGGFLGVIGGFAICALAVAGLLLKNPIVTFSGIIIGITLIAVVPTIYSYLLYRKLHP